MGKMEMPGLVSVDTSIWRVDRENRINFINKAWMDFGIANGGAELPARVLDTDLMDHIVGDDVKRLVSVLMERVRSTQDAAVLPFRCDGPDFRRHMELVIIPIENNGLEFSGNIIPTYDRHLPVYSGNSSPHLLSCGWCNRVLCDKQWLEIDDVIQEHHILAGIELPPLSHTLCPDCHGTHFGNTNGH